MKKKVTIVKHYICQDCGMDYDTKWEAEECKCGDKDEEEKD